MILKLKKLDLRLKHKHFQTALTITFLYKMFERLPNTGLEEFAIRAVFWVIFQVEKENIRIVEFS